MSTTGPSEQNLFDDVAWERFLRILTVIAFVTTAFVFTARSTLPGRLSTIAVGAIGSIALVTAIIGFLIGAASTFEHAEERASGTPRHQAGTRETAEQVTHEEGETDGGAG
jgi:hypothetical protein